MLTILGRAFDLGEQPSDLARPGRLNLPSIGSMWLLRARFVARLGRFAARTCSSGPLRDAPGLDFRARNACFFEVFACYERSMRKTSNIEKNIVTSTKHTSELLRIEPKSIKNCSAWVPKSIQQRERT